MEPKIAFFDTKPYDREFFNRVNQKHNFNIKYFKFHLNADNVILTKGYDVVIIFVNDFINKEIIEKLAEYGVKLIALRSAGFNNVDLKAAQNKLKVVRVPDYSPNSVAEHTVALMLALNRKIHRAYFRTRDANFALDGLMGFTFYGKTAGIIGTGKIGSAGLDVYEEEREYFFEDLSDRVLTDDILARLLSFNNVIITSHQGFFTVEALEKIADSTLLNIKEFAEGKKLSNEVCYKCP